MKRSDVGKGINFLYLTGKLFSYLKESAKVILGTLNDLADTHSQLKLQKSHVVRKGNNRGQTDGRKAYSAGRFH